MCINGDDPISLWRGPCSEYGESARLNEATGPLQKLSSLPRAPFKKNLTIIIEKKKQNII